LTTGRVLQFDPARGYGFVGAGDGGEDVFLHASVFDGDPSQLIPGTRVEFKVMEGDRGRKAFAVRLIEEESQDQGPVMPAPVTTVPVTAAQPDPPPAAEDEQMCDVLSQAEFTQDITEMLLNAAPALSGQQILHVRQAVLELALKHGWVDA
jgi:cold shock protein